MRENNYIAKFIRDNIDDLCEEFSVWRESGAHPTRVPVLLGELFDTTYTIRKDLTRQQCQDLACEMVGWHAMYLIGSKQYVQSQTSP